MYSWCSVFYPTPILPVIHVYLYVCMWECVYILMRATGTGKPCLFKWVQEKKIYIVFIILIIIWEHTVMDCPSFITRQISEWQVVHTVGCVMGVDVSVVFSCCWCGHSGPLSLWTVLRSNFLLVIHMNLTTSVSVVQSAAWYDIFFQEPSNVDYIIVYQIQRSVGLHLGCPTGLIGNTCSLNPLGSESRQAV